MKKASETIHSELFWALIEHHRWWLGDDGVRRRQIELIGGRIEGRILRQIARAYSVSRGILEGQQERLARLINDHLHEWPNGLLERAEHCVMLAEAAKRDGIARGMQVSAMTKLMWFVRPDGWTMYDDLAATGLGISPYQNTASRMRSFYAALYSGGFERIEQEMQPLIDQSDHPHLWAARILDKWLMHRGRGSVEKQEISSESSAYFDILNPREQETLKGLSSNLVQRFEADLSTFCQPTTPSRLATEDA